MFSRRRVRDSYESWKKLFLQNWSLFRASRIGVVGLAIMIAFLIIALAVPFMGLRDPLYWLAPEQDTISLAEYWRLEAGPASLLGNQSAPVDHAIAFRLRPDAQDVRADRIYVPEGPNLFASDAGSAAPGWRNCFPYTADGTITVDPVSVNYGSGVNPGVNIKVLFGTSRGTVYAMDDGYSPIPILCPTPLTRDLGSPITGLAALSIDQSNGTTDRDGFVVGTESGQLFAFTVNETVGGFYKELWNVTLDRTNPAPLHLAGFMIRTASGVPTSSPAFFYSSGPVGEFVYVGDEKGVVYSIRMFDGTQSWNRSLSGGLKWTGAPIVHVASELTSSPTVVYAAVQVADVGGGKVSKVYVLKADSGLPLPTWDPRPVGIADGGLTITYRGVERGVLSIPIADGPSMFLTSSSGWVYSLQRDPIKGANNVIKVPAGSVRWAFQDTTFRQDGAYHTSFNAPPWVFKNRDAVIVTANWNNGTTDPSDDIGTIYRFVESQDTDFGKPTWKKTLTHGVFAMPTSWDDTGIGHTYPAVWVGTYYGDFYSYSLNGQYLAPLPPSWAHTCPPGSPVECRPGQYPSNNYYIFGTDARGRDIFSQLLWGSRVALLVGFASAFFTISIGVIVGLVAGYLGGRIENILMRFTDVILVIPGLPLVIILAAVLGAGLWNIILVIAIVGWPGVARVIRAEVLSIKERPFIDSARVTGASNVRIMFRHIAPNVAPLAFLYMTFAVSGAILTEAALSFIGLGDVNTVSWGIMLQDVSQSRALEAWWWLLPPGLAITLISLAFFLVGRAFDEIVNPRLRKR